MTNPRKSITDKREQPKPSPLLRGEGISKDEQHQSTTDKMKASAREVGVFRKVVGVELRKARKSFLSLVHCMPLFIVV